MEFEYDAAKSRSNKVKHGIDFDEAKELWDDERGLIIPARSVGEPRLALIAFYRGVLWTAIYTVRGAKIRIISVRRSRDEEERRYHLHGGA